MECWSTALVSKYPSLILPARGRQAQVEIQYSIVPPLHHSISLERFIGQGFVDHTNDPFDGL